MSIPPPSQHSPTFAADPAPPARSGGQALASGALVQALSAIAFSGVVAAWTAIGASVTAAFAGACALCLAVPVLGWFIGLPIVLACGVAAVAGWAMVLALILAAWACSAATILILSVLGELLARRAS